MLNSQKSLTVSHMKTIVILMIIGILAAALFISKGGVTESDYCKKVEEARAEQAQSGELNRTYGSRFEDIVHGCL